ncbi:MAG: hypothetical protein M3Q07_28655 [Pseudobdellovibrionaceae bacterium]|uniref:hypothetical protein n=1 Tax=Oligoflexus sp. TaxID=1971216 RepID=UPI0027C85E7E|nr:hypothetical protein [Oligoflexus sp.]MDQ3235798.1 hypothetical protein [Pseudobdellovibrionaceae bacterium]HYX35346.1 hypothetical protein [Oligoflexus sp.]
MKKRGLIVLGGFYLTTVAWAGIQTKTETVEEQEKSEVKVFCSKSSEKDAMNSCQKWLDAQAKNLGARLLTSYCSEGEQQSSNTACLYRSTGELKYVLKKFRTETERNH